MAGECGGAGCARSANRVNPPSIDSLGKIRTGTYWCRCGESWMPRKDRGEGLRERRIEVFPALLIGIMNLSCNDVSTEKERRMRENL